MFDNENFDALDQDLENEEEQSEDIETGEEIVEDQPDGQGEDQPEGDDPVQPDDELQLVELPDGRKVTPQAAVEEYKKLQADYTKKTQRIAELEKAKQDEPKPWQKEDYEPQSWEEVMENATQEAMRRIEAKQSEAQQQEQIAQAQLDAEIAGLKQIDPKLDADAVLDFANKRTEKLGIKYPNFTAAYQDYKMLEKREKLAEKRVVENKKKREADPVSGGGTSKGSGPAQVDGEDLFEIARNALYRNK